MNRKLVVLILLIAFAGSTLLIGETEDVGRPLSPAEQEARRSRINHRSFDDDWELLSRNYETYRRMSEEEREKYRNLYRELQNDRNQRQLDQLLDHYYEWLSALTPHERDSIRKANGYFDVHDYIAMCKAHYEKVGIGADYIKQLFR